MCEIDVKPGPGEEDTLVMHIKEPGGDFVASDSNVVIADDIDTGSAYKCVYTDDSETSVVESGTIYVITGTTIRCSRFFSFPFIYCISYACATKLQLTANRSNCKTFI